MSDIVRANVWKNCRQRGVKRLIMVALADETNSQGYAEFSQADLAAKCECEHKTVGVYLRQLAAAGEFDYEPAAGRGHRCRVWLTPYGEALAPADEAPRKVEKVAPPFDLPETRKVEKVAPLSPLYDLSDLSGQPVVVPPTRVQISPPLHSEEQTHTTPDGAAGGFTATVLAHIAASLGGARVSRAGGTALAWSGQVVGMLGDWTGDDAAAAVVLWDEFRRSDKWRFKGANPTGWPTVLGDWYANEFRPAAKRSDVVIVQPMVMPRGQ